MQYLLSTYKTWEILGEELLFTVKSLISVCSSSIVAFGPAEDTSWMADLVDVEYCEVDILVRTISLAFSTSKRFSGTVSYSRISLELSKTFF